MAVVAVAMGLIHDERTKLRATAPNGLAVASIATGLITPLAAFAFGFSGASTRGLLPAAGARAGFRGYRDEPTCLGDANYVLAMRILGGLVE